MIELLSTIHRIVRLLLYDGVIERRKGKKIFRNSKPLQTYGCDIAKEDLPHVFERFYHEKNASSESVGIGLALSKTILNKENASVTVKSTEG